MEYKIKEPNLKYAYYFNDMGEVYYYLQGGHEKRFALFNYESREVFDHEPGKSKKYVSIPLIFLFGQSEWVDVANLMARTAFNIPSHFKGYTRPKNHKAADLTLKNLEFVQLDREGQRPAAIYDYNGSIPYNMYKEEEDTMEKPSVSPLPGYQGEITGGKCTPSDSVKMDLGERDRSKVAEALYTLIEDRGYAVSNAVAVLMLEDTADVLRLYLEGKDIVEERVVNDMEAQYKQDQEREENLTLVRAQKELLAQGYRDKGIDPIEPN